MLESYLQIDSRGICPFDCEKKLNYLTRGVDFITFMFKPKLKENFISDVEKNFACPVMEIQIPEGIYNFFTETYDCDLRWIPCFGTRPKKLGLLGSCAKVKCYDGPRNYAIPTILLYCNTSRTMVHELIHATRKTFFHYNERQILMEELLAETWNEIPTHDIFFYNQTKTLKMSLKMKSVHQKLFNSFGNKADYIFIRLKKEEIEYLVKKNVNHEKVIKFFKKMTHNKSKKLRFEIICEKLGL